MSFCLLFYQGIRTLTNKCQVGDITSSPLQGYQYSLSVQELVQRARNRLFQNPKNLILSAIYLLHSHASPNSKYSSLMIWDFYS